MMSLIIQLGRQVNTFLRKIRGEALLEHDLFFALFRLKSNIILFMHLEELFPEMVRQIVPLADQAGEAAIPKK
jgi:hypothetical protein